MILHIPHSSKIIPDDLRDQIVLTDVELSAELILMTDTFTDELFSLPRSTVLKFPISRLLVDVERFPTDAEEPMSRVGMGVIYTRTASGGKLKRTLLKDEKTRLFSLYEAHHQALLREVELEFAKYGSALIVDCHSFPNHPLQCDINQSIDRPDFCIGTDPFHTPEALAQMVSMNIKKMGYDVQMNSPYEETLVPMAYYKKDRRAASIMIEINRRLYMNEITGIKAPVFDSMKEQIQNLLLSIKEFQNVYNEEAEYDRKD
jgi:N-formylglutamate deformylase